MKKVKCKNLIRREGLLYVDYKCQLRGDIYFRKIKDCCNPCYRQLSIKFPDNEKTIN